MHRWLPLLLGWGFVASGLRAETLRESTVLAFEFDRDGDAEGWRPNGHVADVRVAGGVISCRGAGSDPILELFTRLAVPASAWQVLAIRLKADRDGLAEVFWGSTDQGKYGGFSQEKSLRFPVRGDGVSREYRLRPFWHPEGRLVRLRLDLYDGARFELDSLRLVEPIVPAVHAGGAFEFVGTSGGWWAGEGTAVESTVSGMEIRMEAGTGRIFSPPLDVEAERSNVVSLRMSVDRGRRGTVFFACAAEAGLHSLSFPIRPDGREHTYNLDLLGSTAWRGRILALALQPSDESGARARLASLVVAEGPRGGPELEPVTFGVDDVRPRAGRPAVLVARVTNGGAGTASNLVARVELPSGLRLAEGGARREREGLAFGEELEWRWRVVGDRTGRYPVVLHLGASGVAAVRRELDLHLDEAFDAGSAELPAPRPVRGPYEVGVYYFPGWPTASQWHPIRRFPERRPVLGWYREGDPEVADWHIRWAVEHGITFFAYDWYWSRGERQLEHALHQGYFRARHRNLLKFCLLWANHNAPGTSSHDDCLAVTRFWIANYFRRPEHLRVDGRPVIIVFSPDRLTADLGTDGVKRAFEAMRGECERAGLGGLHVVACVPDVGVARQCAVEGYDAVTAYTWPHLGVPEGRLYAPFETLLEGYRRNWAQIADSAGIPLLPPICGGWDSRPWHGENQLVRFDRTPDLFRRHLLDAREFLEARGAGIASGRTPVIGTAAAPGTATGSGAESGTGLPGGPGALAVSGVRPIVLIEAWNEFGEGSYVEPQREFGFGYLDAIREVFGGVDARRFHRDWVPAEVELGPYDVSFPGPGPVRWGFDTGDEGWSNVMDLADLCAGEGVLVARSIGNDPAFFGPGMQVRASEFSRLNLRLRLTPLNGSPFEDRAQVFWRTTALPESEATSVRFSVSSDGAWHDYGVVLSGNVRWRGIVTRLRLDPLNRRDVRIELDEIGLAR